MQERLQKFLAQSGVASRRKAEELIAAGRVTVNSQRVQEMGVKVDPTRDLIAVDGKLVSAREEHRYYLLYKPPGCVTTLSDPEGRPTAAAYLEGVGARVFPVGRLDYDAEGAVLFTTDGDLANQLAHPRYGHRRVYLAKVKGAPADEQLAKMTAGLRLDDGPARALEAGIHERAERNTWIRIVVGEGRYHLVKRLCEAVGLQVLRLFRPEFGGVSVEGLRPGRFRALGPEEVRTLRQAVDGDPASAPRRPLPKAARRHGHGPPMPGGASRPARSPSEAAPSGSAPQRGGTASDQRDSATSRRPSGDARPARVERERGGPHGQEKRGHGQHRKADARGARGTSRSPFRKRDRDA